MTGYHELKCWTEPFDAVWSGDKTFELRKNDRNFCAGDRVALRDWDRDAGMSASCREITADVGYVLRGPAFGLPKGYCVFALLDVVLWRQGQNGHGHFVSRYE